MHMKYFGILQMLVFWFQVPQILQKEIKLYSILTHQSHFQQFKKKYNSYSYIVYALDKYFRSKNAKFIGKSTLQTSILKFMKNKFTEQQSQSNYSGLLIHQYISYLQILRYGDPMKRFRCSQYCFQLPHNLRLSQIQLFESPYSALTRRKWQLSFYMDNKDLLFKCT